MLVRHAISWILMKITKRILAIPLIVLLLGALAFSSMPVLLFAQSSPSQEKAALEKELQELETQIKQIENDITKTRQEKDSLKNNISILRSKISKLDLQIKQSTAIIGDLRSQIADTSASIDQTTKDIERMKDQIAQMLQRLYREDQKSAVEIMLSSDELSDFFADVSALQALNARVVDLLKNLQDLHESLGVQKGALEEEKSGEEHFVRIQTLQKQESQNIKSETEQLLNATEGKEAQYKQILADKQKRAKEIRTRIFELVGVPDAPTFGEALVIAQTVSGQTSVRPALLLAVLTQESNLGKNVGQCYLRNTSTGDGVTVRGVPVKAVMKPSRDVGPFLEITKALGRDPYNTPVSCPIPSVGGYGGAMGPAQFIPSTWAGYESKIETIIGKPGDPWNIRDAFLASALYLRDAGAAKGTRDAEWCAAMIYFSGRCGSSYSFYGNSVLAIADRYEKDIETLKEANGN
ncbi:MAG: hypothetical protein A2748_00285 [Candidatus Wildermuthbacteria bacterium RIFCSPHIGHO2_01_FULL_45_20]|uniref:Transglycosylase SLT domain-containing protein n=1 Tax=Candidatus Wildermuthbacteria bacterium RIFCSPHIGHO2_02_FULL_45_25 TaxID=1802450 RepID=A0A1G2QYQ4_9BACT|nr:MAG: hypothetical protein A2748_00285 [Candidatus Wildermuthbacteria bacterium RIFCSPHIGHO2_01_FULL_45_20]OHA65488.1 MAG: hypothetical protein A3C04_02730 [Candidatus Wildermuthbacteria bacterium RIFCSPHIGHO2_02_FULL_45_25]